MKKSQMLSKIFMHIFLILSSVIAIYPLVWMFLSSFKPTGDVMSLPPRFFPEHPTFDNYKTIFSNNIGVYFWNSTYIAILRTAFPVYTSALLGYVFDKFEFKGKNIIFAIFLSTMMVPWIITLIPLYNIFMVSGLLDSHIPLFLPFICSSYGIFLVKSFMHQVPSSLMESARIDGCGEFKIFNKIALPLVTPAMAALGIVLFLSAWDDYLWPFLVLNNEKLFTLTVGLSKYAFKHYTVDYGPVIAGSVISILPVIIVYLIFQKNIVQGISLAGLKG